jgi:hypothetical protein
MDFLKNHLQHPAKSIYQGLTSHKPNRLILNSEPTPLEAGVLSQDNKGEEVNSKTEINYQEKIAARIKALEIQKKNADDIKAALQAEVDKIAEEAFNKALRDSKITYRDNNGNQIPMTLKVLREHSSDLIKDKANKNYEELKSKVSARINPAVEQYFNRQAAATAQAAESISTILVPLDSTKPNSENADFEAFLRRRQTLQSQIRATRAELMQNPDDRAERYKARTSIADLKTASSGGVIDNYETDYKFWSSEVTNEKNPTRYRLQGFLYANDIFAGGGVAGQQAMDEAIKEPQKLFEDHTKNKLTAEDLESGMAMKSYFTEASKYSTSDRVIGTIAGLLRLVDKNIPTAEIQKRYKAHITEKFEQLKNQDVAKDEEKQLQILYSIQSLTELIGANSNWRSDFAKIDRLTDPDAPNAKITDYPGWGADNKNNKTRQNLNGFLYSLHLVAGPKTAEREFERAVEMYKKSDLITSDFSQEMLEGKAQDRKLSADMIDPILGPVLIADYFYRGGKDGFGLGEYLKEAATYSKHEQVKGVIAGLLLQAEGHNKTNPEYSKYLIDKIHSLSFEEGEDMQMAKLSTIRQPKEAAIEQLTDRHAQIMEDLIEAEKQHPQCKPSAALKEALLRETHLHSLADLDGLAKKAKTEIDKFIMDHLNTSVTVLTQEYNALDENNKVLENPLYTEADLKPLLDDINKNKIEFDQAKAVLGSPNLHTAISDGYLSTLSTAENNYFNIIERLEAMKKAIQDRKDNKSPDPDKPLPAPSPSVTPSGGETPSEVDPYKSAWENAPHVEPLLKNYSGLLTVDSGDDDEKVIARDFHGNKVGEIANGTQLIRTPEDSKVLARQVEHLNFIRVHRPDDLHNHGLWIPEEQLFSPESPAPAPESPSATPKLAPNYLDQTFDRLAQQVETNPAGAVFDISYNGQAIKCLVQKFPDGYHLSFNSNEAGQGDRRFNSLLEIHQYIENGQFNQLLAMQTIMDRRNWDRYKDEKWFDKVLEFKRTGDWSMFTELDWHGGDILDSGNAKIDLTVGPDGRINYSIKAPHVGPNGENERSGYVWDFTQLSQSILHAKSWSENYTKNYQEEKFPEILAHERLLTELMDVGSFQFLSSKIGQLYYFNHFDNLGYGYMNLNWENHTDLLSRNRSLVNPTLEYRLNPDNTINWKLTNLTGPNSTRVGVQGQAVNLNDLANQIYAVKNSPAKMTTPNQNLYNLGNFGYNPL